MKTRADYDSPWKEALRLHFHDFLAFFFPEIHADIDWERGYEQLESELQAIARDAKQRRRHVDALVRVYRRNCKLRPRGAGRKSGRKSSSGCFAASTNVA